MKKVLVVIPYYVLFVTLLFTACKKDDHHPCGPQRCQVLQLKGNLGYSDDDSIVINYNNKGNPVSMIKPVPATGFPSYLFWYDKQGRLTDYIGIYMNGDTYEFRHHYVHDNKKRIISDTMHVFGRLSELPFNPGAVSNITNYKYDAQDRIIQSQFIVPDNPAYNYTYYYSYNTQGNLEKITDNNGTVTTFTYDNKVSMVSLHPIWQFLSRDYSRNNPFSASSYNAYGLPTAIDTGSKGFAYFAGVLYVKVNITYTCR